MSKKLAKTQSNVNFDMNTPARKSFILRRLKLANSFSHIARNAMSKWGEKLKDMKKKTNIVFKKIRTVITR